MLITVYVGWENLHLPCISTSKAVNNTSCSEVLKSYYNQKANFSWEINSSPISRPAPPKRLNAFYHSCVSAYTAITNYWACRRCFYMEIRVFTFLNLAPPCHSCQRLTFFILQRIPYRPHQSPHFMYLRTHQFSKDFPFWFKTPVLMKAAPICYSWLKIAGKYKPMTSVQTD